MKNRLILAIKLAAIATAAVLVVIVARALWVESVQPEGMAEVEWELSDREAPLERLSEAIRFETVSPRSEGDEAPFEAMHQWLESTFPGVHEEAQRRWVGGLTPHFVIPGSDEDAPHVVLLAHMDVVPIDEGTEEDWSYPPFSGAREEGHVWGRGTLDNKQSMMAILEAVEGRLAEGWTPRHTTHLVFGHDEEIGGLQGAKAVADELEEQGVEIAAVYDEGLTITDGVVPGVEAPVALIGITEKGYLSVEVRASSEGGHASMPPKELAIYRLMDALSALQERERGGAIDGPTAKMFEWLASEMDLGHRLLFRNLWLTEPLVVSQMAKAPSTNAVLRTTGAPTVLRAGEADNVLPQSARGVVNFRIHPRESIDDVMEDLENLWSASYLEVEPVGEMRSDPGPLASMEGKAYEALETALMEVFPEVVIAPNMLVAAADARHFTGLTAEVYRFQPLVLTEADIARIHGTNERIAEDNYLRLIAYYDRLLEHW